MQQQNYGAVGGGGVSVGTIGTAAPQPHQIQGHQREAQQDTDHRQILSNNNVHLSPSVAAVGRTATATSKDPSFESSFLQERHEFVLDDLYWNQSFVSKESGRRYKDAVSLREHLDVLYSARKNKKSSLLSRNWWPTYNDILDGTKPQLSAIQENSFFLSRRGIASVAIPTDDVSRILSEMKDQTARNVILGDEETPSVSVDDTDGDGICAFSGEKFDVYWNESTEEWRYKDCVKMADGRLVLSSLLKSGNFSPSPPTSPVRSEDDDVTFVKLTSDSDIKGVQDAVVAATTATDDGAVDLAKLEVAADSPNNPSIVDPATKKRRSIHEEEGSDAKRSRSEVNE